MPLTDSSSLAPNYLTLTPEQVMQELNPATRTEYRSVCIHHLIEEQVLKTPTLAAVEFQGEVLSYQELNKRANQLAHYLQKLGVGPDQLVGLCMLRSVEMLVSILAILKAGGAYVPLDFAYPQERLSYMLADSNAQVVLTTNASLAVSPQISEITANVQTVCLDDAWPLICQESDANPLSDVQPHHLAYCIYTSGSTGKPKGVAMEHQALANLMAWHADTWLSEVGTRILLFSPISFDVSFHEIAAGWCTGGTLLQIDEDTRRNPLALLEFIVEHKVEKIYLPFVALQQLALAAEKHRDTLPLREIIVGGEPLQITPEIGRFLKKTGCALQNQYGSTECLVITAYTLPQDPAKWPVQVPVGIPTYNSRVYILDEQLQPMPMGAIGEIYADSDCLARGYYNHPELTNKSFIPNSFKPDFCGRLYKLGDLGRYLPDGNIECLGRVDHQVKIRGFRVELGEIEAVLAKHAFVDECAVMPFEDKGGNKRLVGYVVPSSGQKDDQLGMALRLYLEQELPDYMVPAAILVLDKMPLTPSGKINRRELSQPASYQRALSTQFVMPESEIEQRLAHIWQELLQVNTVGIKDNFFDLGGTSLLLVQAHNKVTDAFNIELPAVTLLQYPTIEKLAGYIYQLKETSGKKQAKTLRADPAKHLADKGHQAIAVIGLACRFPGAENADLFWQNLANGVESITFFSDEELDFKDPSLLKHPNYVNAGAVLSDIDKFDAAFFGYSPKEAEVMDPQQRIFLECAWSALEDAGINPDNYAGSIGVYGGSSMSTYLINNVVPNFGYSSRNPFLSHRLFKTVSDLRLEQGNGGDHLTMRVSYKLNLKGPSVNVQTTCSTSLVAVHVAAQGLLNGECDVALAGGVSVFTPHKLGYLHQEGMILSPDGHCRAFDAQAQGTIFGNGVGVVILKRLDEALAAGDNIVAVIKGSAINNDGASKVGYTAPSVEGQAAVIIAAQEIAEVEPETITYVEAHGTGTVLGDPIEIAGLTQAFERQGQDYKPQYCAIGSVKTNIGHLDEAAGIAGFIKAVLALKHQQIPPSLHFNQPNPHIDFKHGPFYVNTELTAWQTNGNPRRAGVSSFGIGGTNCHIVLEEAPEVMPSLSAPEREDHVLILSGKTEKARRELAQQYVDYLASHPDTAVADMCFTANTGRQHFKHRLAVVAESNAQLHENLAAFVRTNGSGTQYWAGEIQPSPPSIAFLFTGQGSQYVQMGWKLYKTQPLFRDILNQCDEILLAELEQPLLSMLFPKQMPIDQSSLAIHQTAYTQPALFALEYALAQLWKSWGIQPDVVMGHSVGEYVAACVAGVFSLEDGLKLIAARGRLMQSLPEDGEMVSLQATEAQVTEWLKPYVKDVSIAAINGSQSIVISGRKQSINDLCAHLEVQGVNAKPLTVSHAFHSPLMDPILSDFRSVAQQITYAEPQIKLISNVTGALAQSGEVSNAEYWVRHVRQAVRFADGMAVLEKQAVNVLVEIGPKPVLLGLGQQCLPDYQGLWLPSLRPNREWPELLASLAKLALAGAAIDWTGFDKPYARRRLSLPTYPFQRERYWLDIVQEKSITVPLVNATSPQASHPLIGQQLPLADASEIRFHNYVSMDHPVWLKDHVVFDQVIMPGTGYLEMALAAGAAVIKSEQLWLEDVVILKAMPIPGRGQSKAIQTVLKPLGQKNEAEAYTFQVFSLEENNESGLNPPSWVLHASGKVFAAKALPDIPVIDLHAMQSQCTKRMNVADLYQKSRQQNINFGPSYQCMTQLWRTEVNTQAENKSIALDEVKLPEALILESTAYQLHPVMLDIALLGLEIIYPNQQHQNNYIPVGVDRLRVFGRYSDTVWCSAHLHKLSGDQQKHLSADFYLFHPDGQLFAVVEGFKLRHVNRQAMLQTTSQYWNDWLYEVKWQTTTQFGILPDYFPAPSTLRPTLKNCLVELTNSTNLNNYGYVFPQIEALCIDYIVNACIEMGEDFSLGKRFSTTDKIAEFSIVKEHHLLFGRLLHMLSEAGILKQLDNNPPISSGWEIIASPSTRDIHSTLESLACPEAEIEVIVVSRCGSALAQVLRGESDPLQILFPDGDTSIVTKLYRESPILKSTNTMMQTALRSVLEHLPEGRGWRILEIGAGTGSTTSYLLPHLPADRTEYCFTDIGRFFVNNAKEEFKQYPFIQYKVLDIGKDPLMQGFEPHYYDLIVASNVLHATSNLRQTMHHVRHLLAPQGMIMLMEDSEPVRWVDITFGMTEGWWLFTDHDLRPAHLLLSPEQWQTLLPEIGFEAVSITSTNELNQQADIVLPSISVIVAQADNTKANTSVALAMTEARHWLILADKTVGSQLAEKLSAQGEQCILVSAGSYYEQITTQQFIINPAKPEDFHQLLAVVPPLYGIVHCWSLDASETDVKAASLLGCGSALHLVQAVVEAYVMSEPPRLWLTTRGAQAVNEYPVQQITQSSLWGLGKVIALEHPALQTTQVDLDFYSNTHDVKNLFNEVYSSLPSSQTNLSPDLESQIAFRNQLRYVARLSQYESKAIVNREHFSVIGEGTYLITGGLGGLGLLMAHFLVEHGARHLVLVGRSDATPSAKQQLSELEQLGAQVVIAKADVSDYQQVASVLLKIEQSTAPLRGIIHAAGVLDDGILQRLNWQRFNHVLAPKVQGAWNLHLLTKEYALDFFVLFSSSTSLLGTAGQANHAAANAFLDSLASYRQGLGMSGLSLSINWGAWSEVGATARLNLNEILLKQGEGSISSSQGVQILTDLLLRAPIQVGVLPMDWAKFLRRYSAIPPFFASIYKSTPDQEDIQVSATKGERWLDSLKNLPYTETLELLLEKLAQEVSIILGVAPSEIAFEQGFYEMGIDSLGTIEMRNRLQTLLDKRLLATVLFDYPSIMSLGRYLATEVLQLTPDKPVGNQSVLVEKPVLTESLLDELSEDELEQLLLEEMKSL